MSKNNKKLRVGLDVDGCCLNFGKAFINHCSQLGMKLSIGKVWNFFDEDIRSYDVFKNLESDFWLNLEREEKSLDINFTPVAYISHRTCPERVTKKSLINAGLPKAPVIHVKYTEDKVKIAKDLEIDIFIDDRASTVMYFLENGIKAYVLNQIWNEDFNVPRIKTFGELNKFEDIEIEEKVKCQSVM